MAHKFNIDAVHIQTSTASHTEHQRFPYIQTFWERRLKRNTFNTQNIKVAKKLPLFGAISNEILFNLKYQISKLIYNSLLIQLALFSRYVRTVDSLSKQ